MLRSDWFPDNAVKIILTFFFFFKETTYVTENNLCIAVQSRIERNDSIRRYVG